MRGRIVLAVVLVVPPLLLAGGLHPWTWFFGALIAELVVLLFWISPFNRPNKRELTPQQLADELERHLVGNEGPYDWDDTTSFELADERLNRLIPRLLEYDRVDTPEKRKQLREMIEVLRRGEIPG
jgi:hypothetical protein